MYYKLCLKKCFSVAFFQFFFLAICNFSLVAQIKSPSSLIMQSYGLKDKQDVDIQPSMQTYSETIDPNEYILGPGDKLYITITASTIINSVVATVTPTGDIIIPKAPPIPIHELKLSNAGSFLEKELSSVFKKAKIRVSLIEPKRIKVGFSRGPNEIDYVSFHGGTRVAEAISIFKSRFTEKVASQNQVMREQSTLINRNNQIQLIRKLNPYKTASITDQDRLDNLEEISLRMVKIKRGNKKIDVDLSLFYSKQDNSKNPYLKGGDIIILTNKTSYMTISGSVRYPNRYEYLDGDSLHNLLDFSGGFLKDAKKDSIKIIRRVSRYSDELMVFYVDLENGLFKQNNLSLREDDIVVVHEKKRQDEFYVVLVSGEVKNPGIYSIKKNQTRLRDIIHQAGGFTNKAFLGSSKIVRGDLVNSFKIIPNEFNEKYDQNPEMQYVVANNRVNRNFVNVNFKKLFIENDESQNILLEPQDEIIIQKEVSYITVIGKVMSPGKANYIKGKDYLFYIQKSGGFSNKARPNEVLVQKLGYGELIDAKNTIIEPGDVILVQEKVATFIADFTSGLNIAGIVISSAASIANAILLYLSLTNRLAPQNQSSQSN